MTLSMGPGRWQRCRRGGTGTDALVFNGSSIGEKVDIAANGNRIRFARDIGNVVTDMKDIEVLNFNAAAGTDAVTIGDLTGAGVTQVNIELAAAGGTTSDGQIDAVTVSGTAVADNIEVVGSGGSAAVTGVATAVAIKHTDAGDVLTVKGLGGNDNISAATLDIGVVAVTLDGGEGNETLIGSRGADTLVGGEGDDSSGRARCRRCAAGAGNGVFQWDAGDGNDTIEGQEGVDTLRFNGTNIGESIEISANGGRALFSRDVGIVTMDLNGVEQIDFVPRGGADNIFVGDLSGTGVTGVAIDLVGATTGGDGEADKVTVFGTGGNDTIVAVGSAGSVNVSGLPAQVAISNAEAADRLVIDGGAGADVIDASAVQAAVRRSSCAAVWAT